MNIREYSPLTLAFIGDAHYNLVAKQYSASKEAKMDKMQKRTAKFVSAKAQAQFMQYFLDHSILTQQEEEFFKRGRNAKSHGAPKNTDIITYKISTGFESMWGYWYLSGMNERMEEIWQIILQVAGE